MAGWFHASVKTVSRGGGRSATAAAAYRAAALIVDERTGLTHDYTRKLGVLASFIVAPDDAPDWARDRARLWNEAERSEKRGDARVARELELSLPADLSAAEREAIAREVAADLAARYGVAVDVALHAPHRDGDQRNFHAHMLFTTREVGAAGFGKKTRALDDRRQGPAEIERIREQAAAVINRHMERAGRSDRVDHRSLARRGEDREPTKHLGPAAGQMERRGQESDRGEQNREVEQRNAERRRLQDQFRVVELAIEREKRRLAAEKVREAAERLRGELERQDNARRAELQSRHIYRQLELDRQLATEKAVLSREIDDRTERERLALRVRADALEHDLKRSTGLRGFLRRLSGRDEQDREALREVTDTLEHIAANKAAALDRLDRQHESQRQQLGFQQQVERDALERAIAAPDGPTGRQHDGRERNRDGPEREGPGLAMWR